MTSRLDFMVEYLMHKKEISAHYKGMDLALSAVVMEEKGWEVSALFNYTDPDTGDRYTINVTARATLFERGIPKDES